MHANVAAGNSDRALSPSSRRCTRAGRSAGRLIRHSNSGVRYASIELHRPAPRRRHRALSRRRWRRLWRSPRRTRIAAYKVNAIGKMLPNLSEC